MADVPNTEDQSEGEEAWDAYIEQRERAERAEARVAELEAELVIANERGDGWRDKFHADTTRIETLEAHAKYALEGWTWVEEFCRLVPGVDDVFKVRDFLRRAALSETP